MKIDKVRKGYMLYKTVNGKTQQFLLDISDACQLVEYLERDFEKCAKDAEVEYKDSLLATLRPDYED